VLAQGRRARLWVVGAESKAPEMLRLSSADLAARKACFRQLTERVISDAVICCITISPSGSQR